MRFAVDDRRKTPGGFSVPQFQGEPTDDGDGYLFTIWESGFLHEVQVSEDDVLAVRSALDDFLTCNGTGHSEAKADPDDR